MLSGMHAVECNVLHVVKYNLLSSIIRYLYVYEVYGELYTAVSFIAVNIGILLNYDAIMIENIQNMASSIGMFEIVIMLYFRYCKCQIHNIRMRDCWWNLK